MLVTFNFDNFSDILAFLKVVNLPSSLKCYGKILDTSYEVNLFYLDGSIIGAEGDKDPISSLLDVFFMEGAMCEITFTSYSAVSSRFNPDIAVFNLESELAYAKSVFSHSSFSVNLNIEADFISLSTDEIRILSCVTDHSPLVYIVKNSPLGFGKTLLTLGRMVEKGFIIAH
ncbi:MAG: hypothetical protein QXP36_03810 [Conexivisphaerales archaeon]